MQINFSLESWLKISIFTFEDKFYLNTFYYIHSSASMLDLQPRDNPSQKYYKSVHIPE